MKLPLTTPKPVWIARALVGVVLWSAPGRAEITDVADWNWRPLWTRDTNAGSAVADEQVRHDGKTTLRIEHRGKADWSLEPERQFVVREGDLFELAVWLKVQGRGEAAVSVVTRDRDQQVLAWVYGLRTAAPAPEWQRVQTRFVVPPGVKFLRPRLTGEGPATVWVEGFRLRSLGNLETLRGHAPETLTLENPLLTLRFATRTATFAVTDRRTGQTWSQQSLGGGLVVTGARSANGLELDLREIASDLSLRAVVQLDPEWPEFTVALSGEGPLPGALAFPPPFATPTNTYLVVPMNEGISYPATDPAIPEMRLIAYGGHGLCMPFWGATDGDRAQMGILETPDDAAIRLLRRDGKLAVAPEWDSQKGRFGYARKLRYVFFDHGGYVAMCKRYRSYARDHDLLKTLAEKRRRNPNIDLLVGAVNVWYWGGDALAMVRELKAAGIERILWSHAAEPGTIRALNQLGVLTSRYDIYQDVMDPATFPVLRWKHGDWPTAAWPQDLMIGPDGDWIRGWEVEGNDNQMHPCGVVCDRQALRYAEQRVGDELKDHPYRCRFIDTTTASPWRECYAPSHPLTRGESRHWKMELLRLMSEKFGLVTGSETGHDAAVPFVDYFEGMLSLGPYRVPDAGRNMQKIWGEVPERVARFQLGHAYRLPLWELVYHDCVVAQWYWGDYNNKLPALWDKRDLFNLLYGTPPMFMFDRAFWAGNKDRFTRSYRDATTVARATGYSEMLDHRFLTPDRAVQQTTFANGVSVIVNFGEAPFQPASGPAVAPHGFSIRHAGSPARTP